MGCKQIDSSEFVECMRPVLERGDVNEMAEFVKSRWDCDDLCELLANGSIDARRVVCLTLGLVGQMHCVKCLGTALKDEDSQVNLMAEHAMRSILFRCGSAESTPYFVRGIHALNEHKLVLALGCFHEAQWRDTRFAEAFNQSAIAHFMLDKYDESIQDWLAVIEIVPGHFGAAAGMGHGFAQMGDLCAAARCYRQALEINPRMYAIADALQNIEKNHISN